MYQTYSNHLCIYTIKTQYLCLKTHWILQIFTAMPLALSKKKNIQTK